MYTYVFSILFANEIRQVAKQIKKYIYKFPTELKFYWATLALRAESILILFKIEVMIN